MKKNEPVHNFIEDELFRRLIFVKSKESLLITLLLAIFFVIFRTFTINLLFYIKFVYKTRPV